MSVVTVDRSKDLAAATIYAAYGTRQAARRGEIRAASLSIVGVGPARHDRHAALAWIDEGRQLLQPSSGHRTNQALLIIQSWARDELDADSPVDVERANIMGTELAQRLAPDSPVLVATHTDSASGCVHNHLVILNHDISTGHAAPKKCGNWHAVRAENDNLMREHRMRVPRPGGVGVTLTHAERKAQQAGRTIDSTGLALHEIGPDTWADYLRKRVDEILDDERVRKSPDPDTGWEIAQQIAPDHGVSIRVTEGERGTGVSLALVDDDGETVTYSTGKRTRRAATAGSKLGSDYTLDGLQDRVAEAQAAHATRQARQAREDTLRKIQDGLREEEENGTGQNHTNTDRGADHHSSGSHPRDADDDRGRTEDRLGEDPGGDSRSGPHPVPDRRDRGVGAGTQRIIDTAGRARDAAAAARANNSRDGGVRARAAGSGGDAELARRDHDRHSARDGVDPEHIERSGPDVPRHTGAEPVPSAAERLRRLRDIRHAVRAAEHDHEPGD